MRLKETTLRLPTAALFSLFLPRFSGSDIYCLSPSVPKSRTLTHCCSCYNPTTFLWK